MVGVVIHHLDAREKAVVHVNLIAMSSHHGHELLGNLLHLGGCVAFVQSHKHSAYLIIKLTAVVESQNSVLEGRSLPCIGYHLNLLVVLSNTLLKGWHVVLVLDSFEGWNLVLCGVLSHEGIHILGSFHFLRCFACCRQSQNSNGE